jgi:hypothetical protein
MGNGKIENSSMSLADKGYAAKEAKLLLDKEYTAKATGRMNMCVAPTPQHVKSSALYNSGIDPIDANLDGIRLEMARLEFTTKMNELATFGAISKKRYFEIKKLYESKDVESANMASKILDGLHEKMLKE